jgi:hypothetical protein
MSLLKTSYSRSSTESIEPSVLLHFNGGNGPIDVVNEVGDVDYNSSKHRGTAGFGDNGRYTKLNTSVKKMGNSALDMSMNESCDV